MLRTLLHSTMPARRRLSFVAEMGRFDSERMVLQRVQGTTARWINGILLFPHQDGDLLRQTVQRILAVDASTAAEVSTDLTLTVEVLNGTRTVGPRGRARDLFPKLRHGRDGSEQRRQ